MSKEKNNPVSNLLEQLETEFHAFNYTASGIVEKEYVRVSDQRKDESLYPTIDDTKLLMLLKALENKYISSLASTRYSLYDISFRKTNSKESVGFSFNDVEDYDYLSPYEIFKPFDKFDINTTTETEITIQNALYNNPPQFNPVFMIATLVENGNLISVKTYTRLDLKENSTTEKRINLIQTVAKAINPICSKTNIFDVSEALENVRLKFNFVGVDFSIDNRQRFKLYFRNYEETRLSDIKDTLKEIIVRLGFKHNLEQLEAENNLVWGIAVSTDNFQNVNGIQLYLYP